MKHTGGAALGELDQAGGEVAGEGRTADLVGDDCQLVACAGAEAEHGRHKVLPAGTEQPGRPDDRVLRRRRDHRLLTREFRPPVGRQRPGRV
jgi:hypothetical protein